MAGLTQPRVVVASVASGLVVAAMVVGAGSSATDPATAAPLPADPALLWEETFGEGDVLALGHLVGAATGPDPGAPAMTYTADPYWLSTDNCNFLVASSSTMPATGYCGGDNAQFVAATAKAYALGLLTHTEGTNRVLAGNTTSESGITAGSVQLATVTPIPLASASGRFLTLSVDAAATSCWAQPPLFRFSFRDADGHELPVSASAFNPCAGALLSTDRGEAVRYDRFASDAPTLVDGASVGIVLRNEKGTGWGNDGAIDNLRVVDVTPRLSAEFAPESVDAGSTTQLTLTVVNTSEGAEKRGWELTQQLPPGLTVAGPAAGTCAATAADVSASASAISVSGGVLETGSSECTVIVPVTSAVDAVYALPSPVTRGLDVEPSPTVVFIAATPSGVLPGLAVHTGGRATAATGFPGATLAAAVLLLALASAALGLTVAVVSVRRRR